MLHIVLLLILAFPLVAKAETSYVFRTPSCPEEICGSGWAIYIDGEIRSNEGEILEREIITRGIGNYSTVYLNSPGGSLFGGIELGRVIRKYGYSTGVAKSSSSESFISHSGICYSACTLAFLGGEFRFFQEGSVFGVHQFYSTEPMPNPESTAQIASAAIVSYLLEVGIKSDFFVEMVKTKSDSIRILSLDELTRMGVVNNGFSETKWSVEASENSGDSSILYLRGERNTTYGIQKALFFCFPDAGKIFFHSIFDPQGRQEEAMRMKALTLLIDRNPMRIEYDQIVSIELINGMVNATIELSRQTWSNVKNSKSIGLMFQFNFDSPIFLGFDDMPTDSARNFFAGIDSACSNKSMERNSDSMSINGDTSFSTLMDLDHFGGDLTSRGLKGVSLSQCQDFCMQINECVAYSYVINSGWCFPKSGLGSPTYRPGVTSGIKK